MTKSKHRQTQSPKTRPARPTPLKGTINRRAKRSSQRGPPPKNDVCACTAPRDLKFADLAEQSFPGKRSDVTYYSILPMNFKRKSTGQYTGSESVKQTSSHRGSKKKAIDNVRVSIRDTNLCNQYNRNIKLDSLDLILIDQC